MICYDSTNFLRFAARFHGDTLEDTLVLEVKSTEWYQFSAEHKLIIGLFFISDVIDVPFRNGGAENGGVENAGVENSGVDSRGGKCRSGKCRSRQQRWKMQEWKIQE